MKALKFFKKKGLVLTDIPIPEIREGEVLIKVTACSICGSDARILKGEKEVPDGVTLGHEISGKVVLSKNPSLKEDDEVAIFPSIFCMNCESCKSGLFNLCLNKKSLGYALDGGFAEFVRIPEKLIEEGAVLKIKVKDLTHASLCEPLACVFNSFDIMELDATKSLLTIGADPMGLMHLITAHIMGVREITIVDIHEERLNIAKRIYNGVKIEKNIDNVKTHYNAIALCAFLPDKIQLLLDKLKPRGILNIFAGGKWDKRASVILNEIHYREKVLTGTHSANCEYFKKAVEFMQKYEDKYAVLLTHRLPIIEYKKAFEIYINKMGLKVAILPNTSQ